MIRRIGIPRSQSKIGVVFPFQFIGGLGVASQDRSTGRRSSRLLASCLPRCHP